MANDWSYYANIARDIETQRNNDLRNREAEAEARLTGGTKRVNDAYDTAFTPAFYDDYRKKLLDYWNPELARQYSDANRTLNFGFADTQPGGGSAPAEAFGRLAEARDKATLQANDNATGQATQLKQQNEAQRSQQLALLQSGMDPNTVVQQAQTQVQGVPRQPAYSPLGDIFANVTGQFAVANQAAKAGYPGWGFSVGASPSSPTGGSGSWKSY